MWRQIKRTGATITTETARIADASAQIQEHLDRASASGALLGGASARLATSRAKLESSSRLSARRANDAPCALVPPGRLTPRAVPREEPEYGECVRVAAVDIGTNTTRLLVADVDDGRVDEVVRREAITRLGESVDRRRILLPTAIARVRNVLVDYRREAELLGAERVLAVGTSAVRDADNGEAFLGEVEWSYGFTTRLLTGDEEAELTLAGVASDGRSRRGRS